MNFYAVAGTAGSVLSGVGRFIPTLSSSGVTRVVTMTMRTTAGNIAPDISPAMLPFYATISATSPRDTMPRPMETES